MTKLGMLLCATVLLSPAYTTGAATWKLDKNHSEVQFSVAHLVISEVTGVFRDFDVSLSADKADFTDAKLDATIKTSSVDTGNERRDKHLRSDDFLNAEKFPEMTFRSTEILKLEDGTLRIKGNLTIRDVTKPVILETKLKGVIKGPGGNLTAAFKATTSIDRFDFGVKWDKTIEAGGLVAGKDVEITLLMEFTRPG